MTDWHHIEVDGGYRVPLRPFAPDGEAKAAVVFLPAMGVRGKYYETFGNNLAAHGVQTTVMEFRGHGESSLRASHGTDWGYADLALTDLPAAIAWTRDRCPGVPVFVGGHSLGGQLALVYASQHKGAVDGAWMIATSSPYYAYFSTNSGEAFASARSSLRFSRV